MNIKYFDKTNIHFNTPPSITIYKYLKLTAVYLNKQVPGTCKCINCIFNCNYVELHCLKFDTYIKEMSLKANDQEFCVSKLDMTPDVIKMWSAIVGYTATGLKMEKDFPKDRPLVSSTASLESEHTSKFMEYLDSKDIKLAFIH